MSLNIGESVAGMHLVLQNENRLVVKGKEAK
jgi:hypothetical protein